MLAAHRANEKSPTRGSSLLPGPSREGQPGREGALSSLCSGRHGFKDLAPTGKQMGTGGRGALGQGRLIKKTVITIIFKALFICE